MACGQLSSEPTENQASEDSKLPVTLKAQYVFAPSGLNMRVQPTTTAEILERLRLGTRVQPLNSAEPAGQSLMIEGLEGKMVKIETAAGQGYVYSGFLAPFPVPADYDWQAYHEILDSAGWATGYFSEERPPSDSSHAEFEQHLSLPGENDLQGWQHCWLAAQKLGLMYHENDVIFAFPGNGQKSSLQDLTAGKEIPAKRTIANAQGNSVAYYEMDIRDSNLWFVSAEIERDPQGQLVAISESVRGEGFGQTMTLSFLPSDGFKLISVAFAD